MTRLLPRTLRGRLMLIVLTALTIAQLLTWLALIIERRGLIIGIHQNDTFRRAAGVVELIEQSAPSLAPGIVRIASSVTFRLSIGDKALVSPSDVDVNATRRLRQQLAGSARSIRVAVKHQPTGADLMVLNNAVPVRAGLPANAGLKGPGTAEPIWVPMPAPVARDWAFPAPIADPAGGISPVSRHLLLSIQLSSSRWLNVVAIAPSAPGMALPLLLGTTLAAIALIIAAVLSAAHVTGPLSGLDRAVRQFGKEGPLVLAPEAGPDDVRRVAKAFNDMARRLHDNVEHQRNLLRAIGHDLRTPITSLRIRAEFVEPETLRAKMLQTLDEMEKLTVSAIEAARGGATGEPVRLIDLPSLVETVCEDSECLGAPIHCHIENGVTIQARTGELKRALRNLVENAVRYGGGAQVVVDSNDDEAIVDVDDDGPGIPQDELTRVTDAFVRLDVARSASGEGSGLGLTIAKAIIHRHGGTLTLSNKPGGGLRARVRLPVHS